MAKKRALQLSPKSVDNMIEFLESEYRGKRQRQIILDFYRHIKNDLVKIIQQSIENTVESRPRYDGKGMLKDGIEGHIDEKNLLLVLSTDNNVPRNYAAYVEFGTGIVGKHGTKSGKASSFGWIHDINSHGPAGWVYYDERQDRFRWTAGQQAARFMEFSVLDIDDYLLDKYKTYKYKGDSK